MSDSHQAVLAVTATSPPDALMDISKPLSRGYKRPGQEATWLSAMAESSSDAIIGTTLEGTICSWNRGAERLYGYTALEAVGQSMSLIVPTEHAGEHDLTVDQIRQGGRVAYLEPTRMRKDGSRVEVAVTIVPVPDVTGRRRGLTDRRQVGPEELRSRFEARVDERTALLQRQEHQLERLVDAALLLNAKHPLDVLLQNIADSARDVLDCRYAALGVMNPDGQGLANFVHSGLSPEQAQRIGAPPTGKGVLGVLVSGHGPLRLANVSAHPQSVGFPPHHPPMRSFLGAPVSGRSGPFGYLYSTEKNGAEFTPQDEHVASMLAGLAAVAVENERLTQAAAEMLTREEAALEKAHTAIRSRDLFLATVSHDLRNLTGAANMGALLLLKRPAKNPKQREWLERLKRITDQMGDLLEDLLDTASMEDGTFAVAPRACSVLSIANDTTDVFRSLAETKSVNLVLELPAILPEVWADPRRVSQALGNLVRNAVFFSPPDSSVTINASVSDDEVIVSVRDEGPGIPREEHEAIFQRYWSTGKSAGTGLGLFIVKTIVERHGGRVGVQSQPGHGSTFWFSLLREAPAEANGSRRTAGAG